MKKSIRKHVVATIMTGNVLAIAAGLVVSAGDIQNFSNNGNKQKLSLSNKDCEKASDTYIKVSSNCNPKDELV